MSEDFLTKFPKPPELQPISSLQSKIWQSASFILIIAGLVLLATGGWMFFENRLEASKPPPARILDLSAEEIEALTVQSGSIQGEPTTISHEASGQAAAVEPTTAPTKIVAAEPAPTLAVTLGQNPPPVGETAPVAEAGPVAETVPEAKNTAEATPSAPSNELSGAEAKLFEEAALAQARAQTPEPAPAAPSLADNPLIVAEEIATAPGDETAAAGPVAGSEAGAVSPPTRIVADSINLDAKVIEVGWQQIIRDGVPTNVWVVADYAAGWHKNSALPGQGGNIVLSGHHNINGEVFRYLVDLEVGDIISLYVGDQRYDYAVNDKFIVKDRDEPEAVRRANARWIGPFNEERLTLITCWPYTTNTHRLIVIAKPV